MMHLCMIKAMDMLRHGPGAGAPMKWIRALFAAIAMLACVVQAEAAPAALVAPAYPGAVLDEHAGDVTVRVYLSHDPLKKVTAWYTVKVGAMTKDAGNTLWNADGTAVNTGKPLGAMDPKIDVGQFGRVVMDQSRVVRYLKDMTETKDIGVLCEGMHMKPAQQASDTRGDAGDQGVGQQIDALVQQARQNGQHMMDSMGLTADDQTIAAMSDLFKVMKVEALAGRFGHTKKQLLEVYAKYRHLETSWYPTVKTGVGVTSYDRWVLARDQQSTDQRDGQVRGNVQALAARIQAAMAAGRMDEVKALTEQAQQDMTGNGAGAPQLQDQWDHWLAVLKDLDAHAYRTRISINTEPKGWGF